MPPPHQDFGQPLVLEDYLPDIPQPTSSRTLCATCHAEAHDRRCSVCKNNSYCSVTCQASDWPIHKTVCKSYMRVHDARPSSKHRRALYFPGNANKPRFIYLAYDTDGTPLDMAKCFPDTPEQDIKTIAFHNRFLPYWIQLSYDSNPEGRRSRDSNMSIGNAFHGSVVALAYDAELGLGSPALDADTTTLRAVLEYAKLRAEYDGPVFVEQPQDRYTETAWREILGETSD
ncbi:hypothetical protein ACN47E_006230 [Coniothyrium glycines]